MSGQYVSFTRLLVSVVVSIMMATTGVLVSGCGSSEETQMEETQTPAPEEMSTQKTIDSLRAENSALKSRITKLEQENRNITARAAEMETKLAEAREKMQAPPPPPPSTPRSANPEMEYQRGLGLHRDRHYDEALSVFMGLLNTGAPEGLESNCHYWIGECYYGMKQYRDAIPHFEQVFNYPRTTKKDDAQLMIGNCYARMGDKERARKEYQKLIDQYPASPFVERAKNEMAKLK